jgi:hypothetical protein
LIKLLFSGKQMLIVSLVFFLVVYSTNLTVPPAVGEKIIKDWGNTVEEMTSPALFINDYAWGELKDCGMSKYVVHEACYASEDFINKLLEK